MRRCIAISAFRSSLYKTFLFLLQLITIAMLFGCSSQSPNFNEYSSDVQSNKCHLNSIEVALPKSFVGCGNTTKFYESQEYSGICILIGENCDAEDDVAKNLELFRGTDFYKNRIRFEYSDNNLENDEYVSGILKNDRLNTDLYFSGYFMKEPSAYIFCLCDNEDDRSKIEELANEIYDSKSICE